MQQELEKIKARISELEEFKEDLEGVQLSLASDVEDLEVELQSLREKVISFEKMLLAAGWQAEETEGVEE